MPTTTSQPPLFEPPDRILNERAIAEHISLPINGENFTKLITSSYLLALATHDRKCQRDFFDDVLVSAFNFTNRMVRLSELGTFIELLEESTKEEGEGIDLEKLKEEMKLNMAHALSLQASLRKVPEIFKEMRGPEDPVS